MPSQPERRKRFRSHVHWEVCFFGADVGRTVETITENLSCTGFHCFSPVPLIAGDLLTCRLRVPSRQPSNNRRESSLECKVRVVRVEPAGERQTYGVACEIENYRFLKSNCLIYV
jgi:PilZ domain